MFLPRWRSATRHQRAHLVRAEVRLAYPAVHIHRDAIDSFAATTCCLGVRLGPAGRWRVIATLATGAGSLAVTIISGGPVGRPVRGRRRRRAPVPGAGQRLQVQDQTRAAGAGRADHLRRARSLCDHEVPREHPCGYRVLMRRTRLTLPFGVRSCRSPGRTASTRVSTPIREAPHRRPLASPGRPAPRRKSQPAK